MSLKAKNYTDVTEGDSVRIFEDPKMQSALHDDPLYNLITKHWRPVIVGLSLIIAFIYGKSLYQDAKQTSAERSSEAYAKVRLAYDDLQELKADAKTDPKEVKAAEEKLADALKVLSDGDEPYKSLAAFYGGQGAMPDWRAVADLKSRERFFAEIFALRKARLMLDNENDKAKGISELKALASDGVFAGVTAALAFAKVASTEEERKVATAILTKIKENQPEQGELIDEELQRLG